MRDCTLDNVSHENTTPGTIIFTKSTMMNNDDDVHMLCKSNRDGSVNDVNKLKSGYLNSVPSLEI